MSPDDTKVLIGGRRLRKIPTQTQVFVENEDPYHGSVRHRRTTATFTTSTPAHGGTGPVYNNPVYFTPASHKREVGCVHDSGFYGSSYSRPNAFSLHDNSIKPSLWESFTSPVLSRIGSKFRCGRRTFLEDERSRVWSVQPQKVLGFLVFVTVLSSLGFAILITVNHFGRKSNVVPNGKYQSMKYAAEKLNSVEKKENSKENFIIQQPSTYDNSFDNVTLKTGYDPFFDVLNVIGDMSDLALSEKIEELENKIKSKKFKILKIDPEDEEVNIDVNPEDLGEELLIQNLNYPSSVTDPFEELEAVSNSRELKEIVGEKVENGKNVIAEQEKGFNIVENVQPIKDAKPKKSKTKHLNPLLTSVKVTKVSKAKISRESKKSNIDVIDYPDDPTFRGNTEVSAHLETVD